MKIEILYFAGCPNHQPAIEQVRGILKQEGIDADVIEIEIPDAAAAQRSRFLGSPTIRINDLDVEREARAASSFGMTCRTYVDRGRRTGVPPPEWIRAALYEGDDHAIR